MNTLLIFTFLLNVDYTFIKKILPIVPKVFYFLTVLGLFQYFSLIDFLDPFFKFLAPRASAESLAYMGNRGVTLLASEPSRASYEFLFIYIAYRTIFLNQKFYLLSDLFLIIYMMFIIKSGVGLILSIIFLIIFYRLKFILLGAALVLTALPFMDELGGRSFDLLINILTINSIDSLFEMLLNASGFRLISIIASFNYGIMELIGGGIGNWEQSSIVALGLTGLDPMNISYFKWFGGGNWISIRPTSYFFAFMLDTGIVGIGILSIYLYRNLINYFKINKTSRNIIVFFVLYFFIIGSVGNPIPFVCLVVTLRFLKKKRLKYDYY
ncbi:hypothetical protein GJV85_09705 [Sulfurimonas aquatica]|uniref:Uncharacterized protein n=1 Tax=Sulfurimonas aquatica TaxID=2672570 RepID=A0A975GDH5_9BACT|nr:hypothetical protein [Sulfurimonas aquatica]QSZ42368.1 hypothetical protein GJV85_09705 [Sulfurimonas aquatica]